ncbi:MAG: hypothetical protein ACOCV2_12615 [Persicimonas sp.]
MTALLFLSGCQTVRTMLEPHVCDCKADQKVARECPEREKESDPAVSIAHTQRVTGAAHDRAELASKNELSDSGEPSYRQLERGDADEKSSTDEREERDPLEPVDPTATSPRVGEEDLDEVASEYNVTPDDDAVAFEGDFAEAVSGDELVIVDKNRHISVYSPQRKVAELELQGKPDDDGFEELGLEKKHLEPRAVRLLGNRSAQIMMFWREKGDDGEFAYKVGAFKPIGEFVAVIFEKTLATRGEDDDELRRRGTFEVLRGDDDRFVRWIPADDEGELLTDEAEILEWNEWEGVYRVPETPPTAPDDKDLRSYLLPNARLLTLR